MAPKRGLILNRKDNVANVLQPVEPGDWITAESGNETVTIQAVEKIPFGFKVALVDISRGESTVKYGEIIGNASQFIRKGALVHVHNMEGARGRGDLQKNR